MNSTYQYYNEIVLFFRDFDVDYQNGEIVIEILEDKRPFEKLCQNISVQLHKIAGTLEPRDNDILVKIKRGTDLRIVVLTKDEGDDESPAI